MVSLKDGMFNNANVLFKTKFVDGVSTVTRHVQAQSSRHGSSAVDKENENAVSRKASASSKRQRLGTAN